MNKINFVNGQTPINESNMNQLQTNVDIAKLEKTVTVATANTDLNDCKTEGRYYFTTSKTPTNIPAGVNGELEVITNGNDFIKQIWYRHGTANTNDFETYVRTCVDGNTWSNWVQYSTDKIMTGSLTDLSSYFSSIDVNRVQKIGKLVQVNFRGQLSKALPGGSTPYLKAPYGASIGTNFTSVIFSGSRYAVEDPVWCYLDDSGNLRGSAVAAGKYVHISFSYITN